MSSQPWSRTLVILSDFAPVYTPVSWALLQLILTFVTVSSVTPLKISLTAGEAPGPGAHSKFPVCVLLRGIQLDLLNAPVPATGTQRPSSGSAALAEPATAAPHAHAAAKLSTTILKRLILTTPSLGFASAGSCRPC